jgi:hypothetical protein
VAVASGGPSVVWRDSRRKLAWHRFLSPRGLYNPLYNGWYLGFADYLKLLDGRTNWSV